MVVIYGGDEYRRHSDGSRLVPWREIHARLADAADEAVSTSGDVVANASNDEEAEVS